LGVRNVTARIEEFLPPEQVAAARGIKPKRPTTTRATVAKKQQPLAGSSGRAAAPSVVQRASKPVVPPRPPRSRLTFKPAQAWPSYVDGFIVNYSLDADRAARARQVLAELKGEADRHHQQQKLSYDRAAEITDVRVRREQLDRLEEPVGKLFDRLRSRLEQLARVDQPGA
jgi:hypothetical protein